MPPFTVLDARQGEWIKRKAAWKAVIQSNTNAGRGENLLSLSSGKRYSNWYQVQTAARKIDPEINSSEIVEKYSDQLIEMNAGQGTSVFDAALAEVLLYWFSPPGGRVLDPWAGGTVRGAVSAALGRAYTGHELREEQCDANRQEWSGIKHTLMGKVLTNDPEELTPVIEVGSCWVKRDDMFGIGDSRGGKVRTCLHLAHGAVSNGADTLVTAGSRHSPQVNIVTEVANHLNLNAEVHVPDGTDTPELVRAADEGAEVNRHPHGYNTVIVKRASDSAEAGNKAEIPFGMENQLAVDYTAAQVKNVPDDVERIVTPVGSGMSLAGLLHGLDQTGRQDIPILGVQVGADPIERLDEYAPSDWRERVELVGSGMPYGDAPDDTFYGGISLDPYYEAKCLPFIQDGDLFWIVGRRATADMDSQTYSSIAVEPEWIEGDSLETMQHHADGSMDAAIGCPPYYNLEKYGDAPGEMSRMSTAGFDETMGRMLAEVYRILADDSFATFLVGSVRDGYGALRDMRSMMVREAERVGFVLGNDAVYLPPLGSVAMSSGRAFRRGRALGRVHQDVLVFVKGDRRRAADKCEDVRLAYVEREGDPVEE